MGRVVLPLYTPEYIPNREEIAVFSTSKGSIKVRLHGAHAPIAVGNFIELAYCGFYENTKFHAYREGSVVLGGCPTTRGLGPAQVDAAARGVLRGIHPGVGHARYTIKDEYRGSSHNYHKLGSLCLAHKSDPDTSSCQFYFSLGHQPEFDDKFTVFGQTIEGLDVVQSLRVGDTIYAITIENADEKALAKAANSNPIDNKISGVRSSPQDQ